MVQCTWIYLITNCQIYDGKISVVTILCIAMHLKNIVIIGIVMINNLELQILGFALLSFGRLLLFSCHHAYLIDIFGMTNFGTLDLISSFVAAMLGFTSYPLQLLALRTTYAISFNSMRRIGCSGGMRTCTSFNVEKKTYS